MDFARILQWGSKFQLSGPWNLNNFEYNSLGQATWGKAAEKSNFYDWFKISFKGHLFWKRHLWKGCKEFTHSRCNVFWKYELPNANPDGVSKYCKWWLNRDAWAVYRQHTQKKKRNICSKKKEERLSLPLH